MNVNRVAVPLRQIAQNALVLQTTVFFQEHNPRMAREGLVCSTRTRDHTLSFINLTSSIAAEINLRDTIEFWMKRAESLVLCSQQTR